MPITTFANYRKSRLKIISPRSKEAFYMNAESRYNI